MPLPPLKIVFFGTPDLSVPFLEALINEPNFEIVAVVTQPDRPIGRKQIITPTPVKELALIKKIEVFQPENLKKDSITPSLHHSVTSADIAVVVAYGLLIPERVLQIPKLGCINVHPSLLPKYRGPTPIQSAIANGEVETGISIMLLDKGMDTGPILAQEKLVLAIDETQISLTEKIKQIGPKLLIETIKKYTAGEIKPVPQDDSQAVICKLLDRESGHINWQRSAEEIERLVRAYQPWPGTWTVWNRNGKDLRLKILKIKIVSDNLKLETGKFHIKNARLLCQSGSGLLEINELQLEGRPIMSAIEFLKGYAEINGTKLN